MVTITIDGKTVQAEAGTMVLQAAMANNIYIPTLCTNEAVAPYGACRMCLVEITTKWGRERLVTSCYYPVEDGLDVRTRTERVLANRRVIIDLLWSRCPESAEIGEMARELGVMKPSYSLEDHGNCILCALCVRVCDEVVGVSAISLVNRGVDREMAIPFYDDSNACIACGSCAYVCPTDAIKMVDADGVRTIAMPNNVTEFKLAKCEVCGTGWAPEKQLQHIIETAGLEPDFFNRCTTCRA
jgi:NADH dehydrogenase/NADH:ubiquinone oxidoreductase subunit G